MRTMLAVNRPVLRMVRQTKQVIDLNQLLVQIKLHSTCCCTMSFLLRNAGA